MIGGFFTAIPYTVNFWDNPTETITDTAQVLALYKDIAKKNTDTQLREKIVADDLIDGRESLAYSFIQAWAKAGMFFINPQFYQVRTGVPGNPQSLKASDIVSATAEYYHKGKTVEITLVLKDQVDKSNAKSNNSAVLNGIGSISAESFTSLQVQVARLGYTMKDATATYTEASITIRADAATGEIVKANYSYHAVVSANRNEVDVPFQQSFDYSVKKP